MLLCHRKGLVVVNTADIMGTYTVMCQSTHTPSWTLGQVSGGCFLFLVLGGPFNFWKLLWRRNHQNCWSKQSGLQTEEGNSMARTRMWPGSFCSC